jgi:thiamine-monophosphate kinase
VSETNEESVLARLWPHLPRGSLTELGPGDDAAVVAAPDGRVVISTDMLVEGVHFRLEWTDGRELGWRLAAQSMADVAAMGAHPTALVAALAGPRDKLGGEFARQFAVGLGRFAGHWQTGVVGGDLSIADKVVACGTVLGDLQGREPVTRAGARPGDILALADGEGPPGSRPPVLGLGGSAAGLAYLSARGGLAVARAAAWTRTAVRAYLMPEPPIWAGPLAAKNGATALIDVSDGLLKDAGRLARASGVNLVINAASTPLAAPARRLAALGRQLKHDQWDWVLNGGEDHTLLATFPEGSHIPEDWRPIGSVVEAGVDGPRVDVAKLPEASASWAAQAAEGGWDHFTEPR